MPCHMTEMDVNDTIQNSTRFRPVLAAFTKTNDTQLFA